MPRNFPFPMRGNRLDYHFSPIAEFIKSSRTPQCERLPYFITCVFDYKDYGMIPSKKQNRSSYHYHDYT